MSRPKEEKNTLEAKQQFARLFDIPASVLSDVTRLEVSANREVVVTECEGIREYAEGSIILGCSGMNIHFTGEGIRIRSMNSGTITIEGIIRSIVFLDPKAN